MFLVKDCGQTLWSDYNNNPKQLTYLWCLSAIPCVTQSSRSFTKGVSTKDTSTGLELCFSTASSKQTCLTNHSLLGSASSVLGEGMMMVLSLFSAWLMWFGMCLGLFFFLPPHPPCTCFSLCEWFSTVSACLLQ